MDEYYAEARDGMLGFFNTDTDQLAVDVVFDSVGDAYKWVSENGHEKFRKALDWWCELNPCQWPGCRETADPSSPYCEYHYLGV